MDKWKERLVEMLMVRNELYKADKGQLWEYHYPEVAAELSEILLAQEKLQINSCIFPTFQNLRAFPPINIYVICTFPLFFPL